MGKNSALMHAASSVVLNSVKALAGLPDAIHLLAPQVTMSLTHFKKDILGSRQVSLDLEETLIALSMSASVNPAAEAAVEKLKALRGCEVHITHIPTPGDEAGLRKLGVNLTCAPVFASRDLFVTEQLLTLIRSRRSAPRYPGQRPGSGGCPWSAGAGPCTDRAPGRIVCRPLSNRSLFT